MRLMNSILLEYQPFAPGALFFVFLGLAGLTLLLTIFVLMDILFGKFKNKEDRWLWFLMLIVTLGLAGYIYMFKRKDLLDNNHKG